MNDRQQPLFLLLIMAVLGIGVMPGVFRETESRPPSTVPAVVSGSEEEGAPEPGLGAPCADGFEQPARELLAPGQPTPAMRTLIATVPDPIDSVADYGFDRSVDAIRRAAAADNYLLDRFWLPWIEDREAEARKGERQAPCREAFPGRLLFRGEGGRALQVLLVGETATWGLHRRAFQRALHEAEDACKGQGRPCEDPQILIAGPTFSRTAESMRRGMEQFACEVAAHRPFRIVNGSATNPKIEERLTKGASPHICSLPEGDVHYEATIPHDREMLERFTSHLVREGLLGKEQEENPSWYRVPGSYDCYLNKMAVLVEVGTSYAAGLHAAFKKEEGNSCPERGSSADDPSAGLIGGRCRLIKRDPRERAPACTGYVPGLTVEYPPHIARLRTAYGRAQRLTTEQPRRGEVRPVPSVLGLPLERPKDPTEVLPALSERTTYSEELMLTHMLSEMCRQDVRWVGILGTDTMDNLFLAHQVKKYCPGVRLFFIESDVLYTHPEYGQDLDGSIVVSSYPLLQQNRAWSPPYDSTSIAQFASFGTQGLYNAVLELLEPLHGVTARGGARAHRSLSRERLPPFYEARGPEGEQEKAVWITAVGNGSYWPLAVLGEAKPGRPPEARKIMAGSDAGWVFNSTGQWRFSLSLLFFLGGLVCAGYWAARLRPAGLRLPWGLRWAEAFPEPSTSSLIKALFAFLTVAPAAVVCDLAALVALFEKTINLGDLEGRYKAWLVENLWSVCQESPHTVVPVFLLVALLTLAAIDVVVCEMFRHAARWGQLSAARAAPAARIVYVDLAIFAASFLAIGFRRGISPLASGALDPIDATTRAILFRERTGNLSSGISILVPLSLLAAALFLCGNLYLHHLGRAARGSGQSLFSGRDQFEVAGLEQVAARFEEGLRRLKAGWILVAVVAAAAMWQPFLGRMATLEGAAWDRWIWAAVLSVQICANSALIGFAVGWRRLRTLLGRYACTPLVRAFGCLPPRYSSRLTGLPLAHALDIPEFCVAVRLLRRLTAALPGEGDPRGADWGWLDSVPAARLRDIRRDLEKVSVAPLLAAELEASGGRRRDGTLGEAYAALHGAAGTVMELLTVAWREGWSAAGAEQEARGRAVGGDAWLRLAEDFVAIIAAGQVFHALARLRRLLIIAMGAMLLLLAMVISYPFEGRTTLLWVVEAGIVVSVGVATMAFVEMERNEVLSRIQGTPPGSVSWNRPFLVKIVVFAVVPLFTVVAADVPAIGQVLFGWIVPLLSLMQ